VKALAHVMHYAHGVPVRKVPAIVEDLTGVRLTQGAITHGLRISSTGFCVGWSNLVSSEPPIMNFGDAASQMVAFSPALPYQAAFFFRTYQHGSCRNQ
jgi:hypothetical protein